MKKSIYKNTYGYKNFISEHERVFLLEWALSNLSNLEFAYPMNSLDTQTSNIIRNFKSIYKLPSFPNLILQLKKRISFLENLQEYINIPVPNDDWIGIVGNKGFVEPHIDGNLKGHYTRRYNILLQLPQKGGLPIYNNETLKVEQSEVWRCDAGKILHTSEIVEGKNYRVNLALSFSIPLN